MRSWPQSYLEAMSKALKLEAMKQKMVKKKRALDQPVPVTLAQRHN